MLTLVQYLAVNSVLPEVGNYVIYSAAVDNVGLNIAVKFGDSRSNGFREIRRAVFMSNELTTNRTKFITVRNT